MEKENILLEGFRDKQSEILADRVVCENYLGQEEGLSEKERQQSITEYMSLHCAMEKCLYLTGAVMLKCMASEGDTVFQPVNHDVDIGGEPAIASTDCVVGKHITPFGICEGQSKKKSEIVYCDPKIAYNKWLESCLKMKVGDAESVNENSYLICTRDEDGIIYPVMESGGGGEDENNIKKPLEELLFSSRGKRLLMIMEIYDNVAYVSGYLKSDGQKISEIVGFRGLDSENVTVGIGDALQGDADAQWYINALNAAGYSTSNLNSNSDFKGVGIPIEICLEKYLIDLEATQTSMKKNLYDAIKERNANKGLEGDELDRKTEKDFASIELTQNQYDALIIARYQAGSLGEKISNYIIDGEENKAKWEEEFRRISTTHNQELESRASFESELFFGNYDDLSREYSELPPEYSFDFSFFDEN